MKKYTKKQILEAIKYWQKQLNESVDPLLDYIDDEITFSAGKSLIAGEAFFKLIPKFKEFNNKNEELFTKNGFPWQRITDEQSAISIIDMIHDSKFDFPFFKFLPSDIQRLLKTIRTAWDFDQSSPMWSRFHRQNDDGIHMHDPEVYESIRTNKAEFKKENNMKKTYTKKQITEAIAYWKKQLNEDNDSNLNTTVMLNSRLPSIYITQINDCFRYPARKIGRTETTFKDKIYELNTYVTEPFKPFALIFLKNIMSSEEAEKKFFEMLGEYRITGSNRHCELFDISDSDIEALCNRFVAANKGMIYYRY